jgi:hypothetical protein
MLAPPIPYHTVTIDFILGLPTSREGFDACLAIVDKFSKQLMLEAGRTTYTAQEWGERLLRRLYSALWGLPKVMLSDRDPKFLSEMWKAIWCQLGVKLVFATAYHPSTDGQTERMIQSVEASLRHYFVIIQNQDWPSKLAEIEFNHGTTRNAATGRSPSEAVKGFNPVTEADLVVGRTPQQDTDLATLRTELHDAMALTAMRTKRQYDKRHTPVFFKVGDLVRLRLHRGYRIPEAEVLGRKFGRQYTQPLRIIERIGRSAYRLELPQHWRIHDVVSIAHLEPAVFDVYGREMPQIGRLRTEDHHIREVKAERKARGRKHYLVGYEDLPAEYDAWLPQGRLEEARPDLVEAWKRRQ